MRRRITRIALAAAPLALAGCATAYETGPTSGFADTDRAAPPADAHGPSLVAGDALAFNIMLAHGYDTPANQGPRFPYRYASADSGTD